VKPVSYTAIKKVLDSEPQQLRHRLSRGYTLVDLKALDELRKSYDRVQRELASKRRRQHGQR
jgi:hypothetical protein